MLSPWIACAAGVGEVHGVVVDALGLGQSVALAQLAEARSGGEGLERLPVGARVQHEDAVSRAQADVQAHAAGADLGDHRVVAREQVIGVAARTSRARRAR